MKMIMSSSKKFTKIKELMESICRIGGWADSYQQKNGKWALKFDGTREEYKRLHAEIKRRAKIDQDLCQKLEEDKEKFEKYMESLQV